MGIKDKRRGIQVGREGSVNVAARGTAGPPPLCSLIPFFTMRNYYLLDLGFLLNLYILVKKESCLIVSSLYPEHLELGLARGR